jgi:hypothetical protein
MPATAEASSRNPTKQGLDEHFCSLHVPTMPNPLDSMDKWPFVPLDKHLNYATHIQIDCRCGRKVQMLTRELVEKCPGAVTCNDFQNRLKCTGCGLQGWTHIRALGR